MKTLVSIFFLTITSFFLSACGTYDWHQKLTIEVETPDGVKSGSAVTAVSWWRNSLFKDGADFNSSAKGEGVVVDLGSGHFLFALLSSENDPDYISMLFPKYFSWKDGLPWGEMLMQRPPSAVGPFTLPNMLYPKLVSFNNIKDPSTVSELKTEDFATVIGVGYHLKSIRLEITQGPPSSGSIEKILPWLSSFPEPALCKPLGGTKIPFCLTVHYGDFVRR